MRVVPQRRAASPARRRIHPQRGRHRAQREEPASQKVGRHRSTTSRLRPATIAAGVLVAGLVTTFTLVQGAETPARTAATTESPPASITPEATREPATPPPSVGASARERRRESVSRGQKRPKSSPSTEAAAATPGWLEACRAVTADDGSANGRIPDENLCELNGGPLHLRRDAATAFWRLSDRYKTRFGSELCVTDGYRSLAAQERLYATKPDLAAQPGTSNHGWGIAVDLCGGAESFNTDQHEWLTQNATTLGWANPDWAKETGSKPEPWHWEYVG